jgi:hypothetical protein
MFGGWKQSVSGFVKKADKIPAFSVHAYPVEFGRSKIVVLLHVVAGYGQARRGP